VQDAADFSTPLRSARNDGAIRNKQQLKNIIMKKILPFLCLLLLAASCATQKRTVSREESVPVYYTGDDVPAASSGVVTYSNRSPLTPKGETYD
jgi:uncharacterized lipoprotein YajG